MTHATARAAGCARRGAVHVKAAHVIDTGYKGKIVDAFKHYAPVEAIPRLALAVQVAEHRHVRVLQQL